MAITKVWVNKDACTGCGLCEDSCPEIFELNDVAKVKEKTDFNEFEEEAKEKLSKQWTIFTIILSAKYSQ
jgi:ferredoxin